MEKLYKPGIIESVKAFENLPKQRFISFDGKLSKIGEKSLGVCDETTDINQFAPVAINGILLVETGGTVNIGDKVTPDNIGRAVVLGVNQELNGYALDASTAAGEIIRIVRGI